jgi:two-component system cell cycle sensor histidine kinase/response regulator CckA
MDERLPGHASKPRIGGDTATILLVEDQALVRSSIARTLRADGYTVVTAEDGMAALEWCRAHQGGFDLVISDLVMPRMGGDRLYQSLRDEFGPVRFLLMSGYGDRRMEQGEPLDPEIPLLQKPWELREFLITVRRLLAGRC